MVLTRSGDVGRRLRPTNLSIALECFAVIRIVAPRRRRIVIVFEIRCFSFVAARPITYTFTYPRGESSKTQTVPRDAYCIRLLYKCTYYFSMYFTYSTLEENQIFSVVILLHSVMELLYFRFSIGQTRLACVKYAKFCVLAIKREDGSTYTHI